MYPGDMMKEEIPTSDLFILSLVVHHWNAKDMEFMLKKIYNATNPGMYHVTPCALKPHTPE